MSPRKLNFLKEINRHGAVPSNLLYALDGGCRQNCQVALQQLNAEGLVFKPMQQPKPYGVRPAYRIYSLTPKGKEALQLHGIVPIDWKAEQQFWHKVMGARVYMSFQIYAKKHGLRFRHKEAIIGDEPLALSAGAIHHPTNKNAEPYTAMYRPDKFFAIEENYFLVEADCNQEPIKRSDFTASSYMRKLLQISNILRNKTYKIEWDIPSVFFLHVTTNAEHARNIVKFFEKDLDLTSRSNLFKGIDLLGTTTESVPPLLSLAEEPWLRAGHEPHVLRLIGETDGRSTHERVTSAA
jgi:hypothetical protein